MNLDNDKLINELYPFIGSVFDEILINSGGNIEYVKSEIKNISYYYLINSNKIYYTEGFSEIANTIKTMFWSQTLNLWSGNISMLNWASGVGIKTARVGKFGLDNFATSAGAEAITKYGSALTATGGIASQLLLVRAVTFAIFPSVLLGLIIYRLVRYRDIITIINFETSLKSTITNLQLNSKSEFKTKLSKLNTQYNHILKNNCATISNNESKLKCAANHYIEYITKDILPDLILLYIAYLKKNNFDISHITTFQDLCQFSFVKSIIQKQFSLLYINYIQLLNINIFDRSIIICHISYLDNTVKKGIR